MIAVNKVLFHTGRIVATPAALQALQAAGQNVWEFLARHVAGDWGVVSAEDKEANDASLKDGSRLLSAYRLSSGEKIWVLTEAKDDRGQQLATTLMLPSDY